MKYIILHAEGFSDQPRAELGGRTPLQAASTEYMDRLASSGELGLAILPPDAPTGGADIIALALLGYDPRKTYPGPAPFEAVGLGIAVGEQDVVYRCNMVTLRSGNKSPRELKKLLPTALLDTGSLELEVEEARELIDAINEQLGSETIQFYPGTGERHFMVWVGGKARATCVNPEEIVGKPINEFLPSGDGADMLRKLMEASIVILNHHPINDEREEAGAKPANAVWLWGPGRSPHLEPVTEERQVSGTVIATNAVHRGVAICAGLEAVDLPMDEVSDPFQGLADMAVRELTRKDLLYVQAAMPSSALQAQDGKGQVEVIQRFDRHVLGVIMDELKKIGPHRLLLVCDGFRTPERSPVVPFMPYAFYDSEQSQDSSGPRRFSAAESEASEAGGRDATKLFARLIPRT